MTRKASTVLLLAAGLSAAAGCSRTYDGTVVPTYRMTVDRYAGIPLLTMQRTPLEEPRAATQTETALAAFPPVPPAPPAPAPPAAAPAQAAAPVKPRLRRTAARRPAPRVQPAVKSTLVCQNRESEERAVSVVCE